MLWRHDDRHAAPAPAPVVAAEVRERERFYLDQGIHSVPAVIINDRHLISGGSQATAGGREMDRRLRHRPVHRSSRRVGRCERRAVGRGRQFHRHGESGRLARRRGRALRHGNDRAGSLAVAVRFGSRRALAANEFGPRGRRSGVTANRRRRRRGRPSSWQPADRIFHPQRIGAAAFSHRPC